MMHADFILQAPNVEWIQHTPVHSPDLTISLLDISAMHPLASGNKLFKLALNLEDARQQGYTRIVSFGGAFSNHIYSLAAYAAASGLNSVGIIRGEPAYASNPTLRAARQWGMQLVFVDRQTYRLRHAVSYQQQLARQYPHALIIPEGGSNERALEGCQQLAAIVNQHMTKPVDKIAVACGTGGTLAGLVAGLRPEQQVWGFTVVRDPGLANRVEQFLSPVPVQRAGYRLLPADYGGYARFDAEHLAFILQWLEQTGILLDPVYTSKMCRRVWEMIKSGELSGRQHLCLLHTGGLQGWFGMREKVIKLAGQSTWQRIAAMLSAKASQAGIIKRQRNPTK